MSDRADTNWSFMLALLRSGAGAVWLGMACFLDACSLPRTTVAGSITSGPARTTGCRFDFVNVSIWRDGSKLTLVNLRVPEEKGPPPPAREVGNILFAPARPNDSGFWAATRRGLEFGLYIEAASLNADELGTVRDAFADLLLVHDGGNLAWQAPMVRAGVAPPARVLWSGYVHNGVSILLFAGLAVSVLAVRSWPEVIEGRERRCARALDLGLCPKCSYDISGLAGRVCPECGTGW